MNYSKLLAISCLAAVASGICRADTIIKFATLAPTGSSWMNEMNAFAKEVSDKTGGAVKFKSYAGGVQGDEKDVVRKIRLGQLHAGGFTGVGIGEIAPELRVLDAPGLFKTADETDYALNKFDAQFRQTLGKKGYILLGWAEVGFVYVFSANPVRSVEDLRNAKLWMWEGDPIAEADFKAFGVSPIPLAITDVMTSLQTGLINAVYGSPMAVLAMQWQTRTKNINSYPLTNASGAVIMAKKIFDKLTPAQQKILLDSGTAHFRALTLASRQENTKAMQTLQAEKLQVWDLSKEDAARVDTMSAQARQSLAGRLYPPQLLAAVEKAVADFRAGKAAPAAGGK